MTTETFFRIALPSDQAHIGPLLHKVYFKEAPPTNEIEHAENEILVQKRLQDIFLNKEGCMFIAENEGKPIGLSYVKPDQRRKGWIVDDLHTLPEYEGQGVGSQLLKMCEDFVHKQGQTQIHLSVELDKLGNVNFYEKRGYLKQMFKESADKDPQNPRTHLMVKTFSSDDLPQKNNTTQENHLT